MTDGVGTESYHQPDGRSYSSAVRSVLGFTAIVITLLPIPLIYFGVFPTYQRHALFLLFYTPFLCLLTLCYLFYVRDWLARASFANVLDPPPPPDPYYREPMSLRFRSGFRNVKAAVLAVLPVLLVLVSMYCVSRYFNTFDESVATSAAEYRGRSAASQEVGALPDRRGSPERARARRLHSPADKATSQEGVADSLPSPSNPTAVRQYVLRTTQIDAIPRVVELTVFYSGAFLALLTAVTLMGLKEYAKEALGLSEHELMFGRYRRGEAEE